MVRSLLTVGYLKIPIKNEVRLKYSGPMSVKKGNEIIAEPICFFADPGLFEVFTLPMIAGNPKTALNFAYR
jgi:putative ABC transport system permease protein